MSSLVSIAKLALSKLTGSYPTREAILADIEKLRASLRYTDAQMEAKYQSGEVKYVEVLGLRMPDPAWASVHDPIRMQLGSLQLLLNKSTPEYLASKDRPETADGSRRAAALRDLKK